jgi:mannose-6-phosphate isomerase-like protein (cupin superfamily)
MNASQHARLSQLAKTLTAWRPESVFSVNQATLRVVKFETSHRAPAFHTHDVDECYVVLDGELVVEIEGQPSTHVSRGDAFVVRAGTKHRPFAMPNASILLIT